LALAIKLGVWVYGEDKDLNSNRKGTWGDAEEAAVISVYEEAIAGCGFDPVAVARTAVRKRDRANAVA
jgi:hypothetical protein